MAGVTRDQGAAHARRRPPGRRLPEQFQRV
jgi:hypothetical protein